MPNPLINTKRFLSVVAIVGVVSTPQFAVSQTSEGNGISAVEAVLNHPSVTSARARICSAGSQYDRARSQQLPQADVSLQGGNSLSSQIETANTRRRSFESSDEAFDAVLGLDQVLFDWGSSESDKQIALNDKSASRISMTLEIDRIAADIVDLSLKIAEHQARYDLYQEYLSELRPLAARVEEAVNVGVLRIGDLRAIKVIELDADIAASLAERQRGLVESELNNRFGLSFEQAQEMLDRFLANRPEVVAILDSNLTREVRRIDHQIRSTQLETVKLKAERLPNLSLSLDLTLFDVDQFEDEYELVSNLRLRMPIYDGGSNKARRSEANWQQRGLQSERANVIRQHRNISTATTQNIERARGNSASNAEKLIEVEERYTEVLAREGETVSDPLNTARTLEQLVNIRSEQISLKFEIELGLLQGLFFADELGAVLEMPYGGPQC